MLMCSKKPILSIINYDIFEMYLRKPVLEHMRMENVSFGHHLGHLLGMNVVVHGKAADKIVKKNTSFSLIILKPQTDHRQ